MDDRMLTKIGMMLASGTAIAAPLLPVDDWAKLGVAGVSMFINWWLIAKTIPVMSERHSAALKEVALEIKEGNREVVSLFREALIGKNNK